MSIPHPCSNPLAVVASERTFFVTSATSDRRNLLQSHRAAALFLEVVFGYRAQGIYRLHKFVVMPNHFHLLITVDREMTIERAVQFIKGGFAFRAVRELGFKAPVWQKGFSEVRVLESEAFSRMKAYIRNNPVRARLADRPEDYAPSSAKLELRIDPPPQRLKPR
jgi:putative transposase